MYVCILFLGSFTAKKLASVVVHIVDQSSAEKLPGKRCEPIMTGWIMMYNDGID